MCVKYMPYITPRCDSCKKLYAIGKLDEYERMWLEGQSATEIHVIMSKRETVRNLPSYDSWKRHIRNHLKGKLQEEAQDFSKDLTHKRMRESASVLDEIMINLNTCRTMTESTTDLLKELLSNVQKGDSGQIREMTSLNNSITGQISEIRRTLELIHKLRRELKIEPGSTKKEQLAYSEIFDRVIPIDVLIKLRNALTESGLSAF